MATVALPTLHDRATATLTDPADIAAALIRWMFSNPGRVSDHFEHELISFRQISARYPDDVNGIAMTIQTQLQAALNRYFPDNSISVSVTTENITSISYKLTISITDSSGNPLMKGTRFNIQDGLVEIDQTETREVAP